MSGGDLASLNGTVTLKVEGYSILDAADINGNFGNLITDTGVLTPTGTNDNTFTVNNTGKPLKPTGFTATKGVGQVTLSWADPSDTNINEYEVRRKAGSAAFGAWADISGSGATTTSYTVTGLTNGTLYGFQIRAVDYGDDNTDDDGGDDDQVGPASDTAEARPGDLIPILTGTIADQQLTQGTSYTSAAAFPAATSGDLPINYSVANLPTGITLNSDRKLTGTATAPLAKTSLTYTATDSDSTDPDSDTLTFNLSVQPKKPTGFSAAPGATEVTLGWTAIAGVTKWQYQQDTGSWTDISLSGAATASYTITGLTASTEYTFKVRAVVGAGANVVTGVESDEKSATTGNAKPSTSDFEVRVVPPMGEQGPTPLTQSRVFPFTGVSVSGQVTTLVGVTIKTLPDATDGTLRVQTRYSPPKRPTTHNVSAGEFIANDATKTRVQGKPLLYFESAKTFDGEASFTFTVSSNNEVSTTHTATLKSGNHPPRVSNLIEDASVVVGTSLVVALEEQGNRIFYDPDGDALTYCGGFGCRGDGDGDAGRRGGHGDGDGGGAWHCDDHGVGDGDGRVLGDGWVGVGAH